MTRRKKLLAVSALAVGGMSTLVGASSAAADSQTSGSAEVTWQLGFGLTQHCFLDVTASHTTSDQKVVVEADIQGGIEDENHNFVGPGDCSGPFSIDVFYKDSAGESRSVRASGNGSHLTSQVNGVPGASSVVTRAHYDACPGAPAECEGVVSLAPK